MSWEWRKLQCAFDGTELPDRHVAITVNGTGSPGPFDWGFSGEVGSALNDEEWFWQPVAYPAATFPMGPSVQVGVDEVVRLVSLIAYRGAALPTGGRATGKIALSGYSQGALVVDHVWRDEILSPSGRLHHLYAAGLIEVIAIVNFGDPMRAPGICNGNVRAGFPIPKPLDGVPTGGIAGKNALTAEQTPDFLLSCNNDGDLYGAAPSVASVAGQDEQLIFDVVQNFTIGNVLAILQTVLPLLNPAADVQGLLAGLPTLITSAFGTGVTSLPANATTAQIVGFLEALLNGGMFVLSGFGPHGDYEKMVPAMVEYVTEQGQAAFAA